MFEIIKQLGFLVEYYGFSKSDGVVERAAEYFFSKQSDVGDFRGFYGNQYSPNYTGAALALLVKAGFRNQPEIKKCFSYFENNMQEDGGWAIPFRTSEKKVDAINSKKTIEPDFTKPSSYFVTGDVLRTYAEHPQKKKLKRIHNAAELMKSYFFKRDRYVDRAAVEFWYKIRFPFWYTNLLSALDTLSKLGYSKDDPQIKKAIDWFVKNQEKSGLWKSGFEKGKKETVEERRLWVSLVFCRALKTFYE